MKFIDGDLLDQPRGVLCHQVNLRGVMGAGIALQIRKKWPNAYDDYIRHCRKGPAIGNVVFSEIIAGELFVAHLFGQADIGIRGCQTRYIAYPLLLDQVRAFAAEKHADVFVPYGIGCGLGGGDWSIMSKIITAGLPEATIVRWNRSK